MKVFKITTKNLKLLLRSKTSMFVIIFGPLLIMLLVGVAFNNPSASKMNIGYYAKQKTNLTTSFIQALQDNPNFAVVEYANEPLCIEMIEQGKSHICIVFPEDFRVANDKENEVIFYVDQSRANFVYAVIDTVSTKIDFTSSQISFQMTNELLSALAMAQKTNNENIGKIISLKAYLGSLSTNLESVKTKLGSIDLTQSKINSVQFVDSLTLIQTDVTNLRKKGLDVIDLSYDFLSDIDDDGYSNGNLTGAYSASLLESNQGINSTYNLTSKHITALNGLLSTLGTDMDSLNKRLAVARNATIDSKTKITDAQTALDKVKADLDAIKTASENLNAHINSLKVTSAESIVNPIKTTVKPINARTNNLNFVFPYLVILIIAFISIMLSSTIIIIEKTSKAYFRNFTTPTKDFTFIASVFLTSFVVVIIQLIFVLILAYYFLNTSILTNVLLTLLTLLASLVLFTLIGMIIGYLFNSQEAVTMASISIGSVFLFLSNLILPLETMSSTIQNIARYNPYVVASELLKKVTLFSTEWNQLTRDFMLLGIYVAVALVLALIIQKMSKIQYISRKPIAKQIVKKKEEIIDKFFKLKSGILLRNEKELLDELNKISDETFSEYVNKNKNDFESWMLLNRNKHLAKMLGKCKTKQEMIKALEEYRKEIK
ncbi:TPA: ABC transporter permease [Candidatus Woesearchaeota archaeon]|nr:ABC transporter permease [Candidatus Woesearchaeota archaeon]HIH31516.1 ABC transporter permease [Candidatus Woesearchaeota archaeon]HIH54193.1 ABC transporter permease [Candidatus Woesearchaeota archaeon]HIJ02013.1 ABC transporter permease [Candidatus Woesearchaeota archaeon]HIJ13905.1 ABC transporter permease [Candidatus Woesearchaeota archaeon]